METTKGKLRNITTGILHTPIGDVYEFFNEYTGEKGIMTHHLPSACKAVIPILKKHLSEEWFTEEWIKEGLDEPVTIPKITKEEFDQFWIDFEKFNGEMWDKIKDKTIIVNT